MVIRVLVRALTIAALVAVVCWHPRSTVRVRPVVQPAAPPISRTAPAILPSQGLVYGTNGRLFAVVHWQYSIEECSNEGGEHDILEIDAPGATHQVAHAGGHGSHLRLGPSTGYGFGFVHPGGAVYLVAELTMMPRADKHHDDRLESGLSGWCLDQLPRADAEVLRLVPARDLGDARRMLVRVAALGMPPALYTLSTTQGSEVAIARITAIEPEWSAFSLEAVDGTPPASIALPALSEGRREVGDLLVIETDHGAATRVLAADDLASARRWVEDIRDNGWPAAPVRSGSSGDLGAARWTMLGSVVAGPAGCDPVIVAHRACGSSESLTHLIATAPPGIAPGDTVIAVAAARFDHDPCGTTMRTLRVHRAPRGFTGDQLAASGIPAGLPAIGE